MLTTDQIEALLFPPDGGQEHATKTSRCRERLKKLFQYGYLARDERPIKLTEGRKPFVYFLDEKGAVLVAEMLDVRREEVDWDARNNQVGTWFVDHLIRTNDVRIAISLAAEHEGLTLAEWLDEFTLKSREMKAYAMVAGPKGGARRVPIVPDGFFVLEDERASTRTSWK